MSQAGVQERDGIKIYDISYKASVGDRASLVGPNGGNVTAYLVVPPGKGPFPAVIYGHWCMPGSEKENRKEFLDEAVVLAHSGVISLLPDHVIVHPGFVADNSPLNEQQVAVEVQQDINLRRGADLLLARDDVDPKRLAYVGHSCDAGAGAISQRNRQTVQSFRLDGGRLCRMMSCRNRKCGEQYRQKIGPEKFDAFQAKYSWMDTGKYVSHAAPASVFLQFASDEPFVTPRNGEGVLRGCQRAQANQDLRSATRVERRSDARSHRVSRRAAFVQGAGSESCGGDSGAGAAALAEGRAVGNARGVRLWRRSFARRRAKAGHFGA